MTTIAPLSNGSALYIGNEASSRHFIPNTDVLTAFNKCQFESTSQIVYWLQRFRNVGTPMSRQVLIREMLKEHSQC